MTDRIQKWRNRAQIAAAVGGMAYSYSKGFNTLSSEMPPATRSKGWAKKTGKMKVMKAMKKMVALNRIKAGGKRIKVKGGAKAAGQKFVATHSTGYVGAFKKATAKSRPARVSKFDTSGIVLKREYSDIVTGPECVYVGHGTPMNQVVLCAVRALVRSHWKKAGLDVSDWNDAAGFAGYWNIYYTLGNATPTVAQQTTISASQTFLEIADVMTGLIRASITDALTLDSLNFVNSRILILVPPETGITFSEINLKNYMIEVDYWSIIKIKNVTLAGSDTANTDRDLSSNIESQPLLGKLYATRKWGNGFQLYKQLANGGAPNINANVTTGSLALSGNTLGFTDANKNPFLKPPPAYMLSTNKYSKVRINPGELKTDVVKFKTTLYWNSFVNKVIFSINKDNDDQFRQFGACHMFAFEREVEIGPRATDSLRIAYQVDFVLKMCGRSTANKCAPLTDVTD